MLIMKKNEKKNEKFYKFPKFHKIKNEITHWMKKIKR